MVDQNFMRRIAPFLVLEVLKAHTDAEHGLKVTQIVALVEEDYGIALNRKAVSSILNDLLELSEIPEEYSWKNPMRFSIKYDVVPRSTGDIRENWRICHEFEDAEIRMLIDLLESVPMYPDRRLREKLQSLNPSYRYSGAKELVRTKVLQKQIPITLDCIDKAIREEKKITFHYGGAPDEKTGERVLYTVSPYKTTFCDGIYYLIGYEENADAITHFKIHIIRDVEMTEASAKDYHTVESAAKWQYDFRLYMKNYIAK